MVHCCSLMPGFLDVLLHVFLDDFDLAKTRSKIQNPENPDIRFDLSKHSRQYTNTINPISTLFFHRYELEDMLQEDKKLDVVLEPDYHTDLCYRKIVSCIKQHRYLVE